jgi:hypothetical protein
LKISRSNGCWIDVFDAERFAGNRRRLHGPAEFLGLRIREKDWGDTIASANVGPAAYVQCFDSRNFDDTIFWLLPNQPVETLGDIGVEVEVDSIRLYDRPPFAYEPGYAAYMLWAASQLAKMNSAPHGQPGAT